MNQSIVTCQKTININSPVILWNTETGLACPNRRGRSACTQHNPILNNKPPELSSEYSISNLDKAYGELKKSVYQLIIHYDACYSSHHCHKIMTESSFKGSHFYLDLDGTIYQTCDLYWKTNTAPADDRNGNERAIHVEISNLSSEALKSESNWHKVPSDQYRKKKIDGNFPSLINGKSNFELQIFVRMQQEDTENEVTLVDELMAKLFVCGTLQINSIEHL